MHSDHKAKLNSLNMVWSLDDRWERKFQQLNQWVSKYTTYPSIKTQNKTEKKLANWVTIQRQEKNKICGDRKIKLQTIGFIWDSEETWTRKKQDLTDWILKNKKYPSRTSTNEQERVLYYWVCTQRRNKNTMSQDYKLKLNEMGFIWEKEIQWPKIQQLLDDWILKNNRYPTNKSKDVEEKKLGDWVQNQRKNKDTMSKERKSVLNKMGFIWEKKETWPIICEEFIAWILKNNNYPFEKSNDVAERKLGIWVKHQRENKEKIQSEKKSKLDEIGFFWSASSLNSSRFTPKDLLTSKSLLLKRKLNDDKDSMIKRLKTLSSRLTSEQDIITEALKLSNLPTLTSEDE